MKHNPLLYLFLKLNIWLSFTSTLMVVATAMVLSIPLSTVGIGLALPALLFYFIYAEDRRSPSPEDRINQPYRTQMVEKYQTQLLVTEIAAIGAYELIVIFLIQSTPSVGVIYFGLAQLPLVVLVVYDQLKQYPTFDSLAVGGTWSFVIVFSATISTAHPISPELVITSLAWLIIVFAGVESRNIQDIEGDTETRKTTLAGYLGKQNTRYMNVSLKTLGVLIFWALSDPLTAGIVITYLLLLQAFRALTERADNITREVDINADTTIQ
jgi:1,4-dihydroxy-2-naphthoate octaprenyltransferase